MNVRRLTAAALAAGALALGAAPAAATCYVGSIDICHKPTDPYTDPVFAIVGDVQHNPALDPVWPVVGDASRTVSEVYGDVLCAADLSTYC
jgi:hypothetical protein